MKEVIIYTDGACSGNPGPGGWAAVLLYGDKVKEISGGEAVTTNQRMELLAAAEALSCLKEPCQVRLYSDSAYLVNCFRQKWYVHWQKNGWVNSRREPVQNRDLWERILKLAKLHRVEWLKVKGHSGDRWNERCDELARRAIEDPGNATHGKSPAAERE
jgi:ribonuclease HI